VPVLLGPHGAGNMTLVQVLATLLHLRWRACQGGNVLELRVADRADLDTPPRSSQALAARHPASTPKMAWPRCPFARSPDLIAAGRPLDDADIGLIDLGIRRPSLDDAFLALTGHTRAPRRRREEPMADLASTHPPTRARPVAQVPAVCVARAAMPGASRSLTSCPCVASVANVLFG
jgi:hypothetical protein